MERTLRRRFYRCPLGRTDTYRTSYHRDAENEQRRATDCAGAVEARGPISVADSFGENRAMGPQGDTNSRGDGGMATGNLAERLSAYAAGLRFEDLTPEAVHEVKRRLLDSLGCAMGAYPSEPATIARRLAGTASSTFGATVIGSGAVSTPELAAFANGVHFRYLDYNDTYLSLEPAHPSDNLAAVLAVAEPAKSSGRDIITAAVLAYEIQCRMC